MKDIVKQAHSLASIASFELKNITPDQLSVIKATIAKGATDTELQWFLYQASTLGLNPLLKEIWFIKRLKKVKGPKGWDYPRLQNGEIDYSSADPIIITSIDGYMKKASENPDFMSVQSMEVRANDEFEMEFAGDVMKVKKHSLKGADRGAIVGAWACVTYKNGPKDWNYVQFDEWAQYVGDGNSGKKLSGVWANNPSAMIKKCAMSPLLKKAGKLSGIYTEEELSKTADTQEVQVLDNSPSVANIRELEITTILDQLKACPDMETYKAATAEITKLAPGFLKEEREQIMAVALEVVTKLKKESGQKAADQQANQVAEDEIKQVHEQENKDYEAQKDKETEEAIS